jgi:hypothetical protein
MTAVMKTTVRKAAIPIVSTVEILVYNLAPRNFRDEASFKKFNRNLRSRHRDVIFNNKSDDDKTADDASVDTYVTV